MAWVIVSPGDGPLWPVGSVMGGRMNDIYVTLSGNVAADPRQFSLSDGSRVTSLRVATSRRYVDRQTQEWHNTPPVFFAVRCYRALADNVAQSVQRGQPVVVHGRLRIREYERDGQRRFMAEVEASSVGHDLKWGITSFEKPIRVTSAPLMRDTDREELEGSTLDWEQGGETPPTSTPDSTATDDPTPPTDQEIPWPAGEQLAA
jgi:single-strand DNA-binding protein